MELQGATTAGGYTAWTRLCADVREEAQTAVPEDGHSVSFSGEEEPRKLPEAQNVRRDVFGSAKVPQEGGGHASDGDVSTNE